MADDVTLPGTGDVIAADAVTGTGEKVQLFKLAYSADGSRTLVPCDANGLTVQSPDATKFLVTEASGTTIVAGLVAVVSELEQKLEPSDLSGLATSAKQDTGNSSLSTIATNTTSIATAARQDTGNTSLSSIDGKITAVNTGAVTVSTSLPAGAASIGQVTANAGSNLNTSLLALEAGGNLASIKTAVEVIDNFISGTKGLVTEDNSASIKTAVETIDNFISGARGLVTEDSAVAIKTAVEVIDNFISGARGLVTEDNSAAILSGMATAANQTTGNASLSTIATNTAPLVYAQMAAVASLVGPMVQGRVTDSVDSLVPDTVFPLSMTTEGRLRVVTVSESPNFTQWGDPFAWGNDGSDIDAYPASAW